MKLCSNSLVVVMLAASFGLMGCSKARGDTAQKETVSAEASASLSVREDATDLLFTWIDDQGEFHVDDRLANVPVEHRDVVRVIDRAHEDPPEQLFLGDLRQKGPDGTFKVPAKPRAELDAVVATRRGSKKVAAAGQDRPAAGEGPGSNAPGKAVPKGKDVVVYGASWCGACQKTRAFLTQKHVPFVDKDIEEDSSAAREMRMKLSKAGLRGGGIPVVDVGGKVMVGFDPGSIEAALGEGS